MKTHLSDYTYSANRNFYWFFSKKHFINNHIWKSFLQLCHKFIALILKTTLYFSIIRSGYSNFTSHLFLVKSFFLSKFFECHNATYSILNNSFLSFCLSLSPFVFHFYGTSCLKKIILSSGISTTSQNLHASSI